MGSLKGIAISSFIAHRLRVFQENCCNGKVLDYGCGTGANTRRLATLGCEVWGVDCNKDRLSRAMDETRQAGLEGKCHFCEVSITEKQLPFKWAFFDSVFASEIIEHVPDILTFIAEVKRVLRKDGTLYLTTPNCVSYRHIVKNLIWDAKRRIPLIDSWPQYLPGKEGHIYCWDVWTLYRLMHINGFSYVTHDYAEQHTFFRIISGLLPLIRRLRTGLLLVLRHGEPERFYK